MNIFPRPTVVEYDIAGASAHSGRYSAENVLVDKPNDQGSRWSGAYPTTTLRQWLRLRVKAVCVLRSITFGKYYKVHPCNMKEFKVYVGMTEDSMTEILHAELRNDSIPETFTVRSLNRAGMPFPTRFIEIVPISAHGPSFNISVWHVLLSGIMDETYIENIRQRHEEYRERIAMRHVAKYLRQRRFLTPADHILARSGLQLEHPLITALYQHFVLQGDWTRVDELIPAAAEAGLFSQYQQACQSHAEWSRIEGLDPDGDLPSRRGGHAMCIDEQNGLVYLFGGWDGQRSLDDFWVYDIARDSWRLLSPSASREKNGPGPRACHKMVFDSKTGSIYLLGKLGDREPHSSETHGVREAGHPSASASTSGSPSASAPGSSQTPCSEFYRYHTRGLDAGKWDLLSFDTAAGGGPPLVSDHQMVVDSENQIIHVSGGRVAEDYEDSMPGSGLRYAGQYSYEIRTSRWNLINQSNSGILHPAIPSRYGHSMVFDPTFQTLFIFGGQRGDAYLADMYAFHVPTSTITELFNNFSLAGGPEACFTQRAVIDPTLREIYVICGLTRPRGVNMTVLEADNPYWVYRYQRAEIPGKWSKIMPSSGAGAAHPQPRYAHQAVYHHGLQRVLVHGGNAGLIGDIETDGEDEPEDHRGSESDGDALRLDDFWAMRLVRPETDEIVRRVRYEILQQQFREICEDSPPIKALTFLQTKVSSVVDHDNAEEAAMFQSLLSHLLSAPSGPRTPAAVATPTVEGSSVSPHTPPSSSAETQGAGPRPLVAYLEDPGEAGLHSGSPIPPARFRQRTETFERIMKFVNGDAKEPDNDLLDIIPMDGLLVR